MGYELVDLDDETELERLAAMKPRRYPLQPQQLLMADALNAVYDEYVVEVVRRASKTTSIFCWLLGRMKCRSDYQVTFSAQNGVKGTARLREWKRRLDAITPPDDLDLPPWLRGQPHVPKKRQQAIALFGEDVLPEQPAEVGRRGFKIMMGEVGKGIYFENGSTMLVLKPDAEAYRGEAADVSWIDEAQEIPVEEGSELLAGILPLMDTKPGSAIVLSGTAGEARVGVFWASVDRIRHGDPDIGGVDYCAPDDTPWDDIEDEDKAMALLQRVHPGIGTLTTLDKMLKNYRNPKLSKPAWAREYLSLWPEAAGISAIPSAWWETARSLMVEKPRRVAFGFDIKPGGSTACLVAAWRDEAGVAYIEVVQHRLGTSWMPELLQHLSRSYPGSTIAYDTISESTATVTEAVALRPKPRLQKLAYGDIAAGCVQVLRDLERGTLRHFDDPSLNSAQLCAIRRDIRGDKGIWLWGIGQDGGDITPLVAATLALRNWDQYHAGAAARPRTGIVVAA